MSKTKCRLTGGEGDGLSVDVAPNAEVTFLYHTPVKGPMRRLIYQRTGPDRFVFQRAEPFVRESEAARPAATHSAEKLIPELKDWDRRSG